MLRQTHSPQPDRCGCLQRPGGPPERELEAIVSNLMWALGTENRPLEEQQVLLTVSCLFCPATYFSHTQVTLECVEQREQLLRWVVFRAW